MNIVDKWTFKALENSLLGFFLFYYKPEAALKQLNGKKAAEMAKSFDIS